MTHPNLGIDHCFALVNDLEEAADQYRRIGFTLSPLGTHSEAKGSANYTIMFQNDYFELLGLIKATPLNANRRALLSKIGQGLHAVACRIENADEAQVALDALGIKTEKRGDFERPVPLPDGSTGRAAFSTLSFAPEEVPRGTVFMCQHHTPETVWQPQLLDHANGAVGIAAVVALSDDPISEAPRFARLWRDGAVVTEENCVRVETGAHSAPLLLMSQAQFLRDYPGIDTIRTAQGAFTALRIKTKDVDGARRLIQANGLVTGNTSAGFAISTKDTSGCVIEFTQA